MLWENKGPLEPVNCSLGCDKWKSGVALESITEKRNEVIYKGPQCHFVKDI